MSVLLRVGVMVLRVVLAGLVGWLAVRHRRDLPAAVYRCWLVILATVAIATVNGVAIESLGLAVGDLPADSSWRRFKAVYYDAGYLVNASLAAMLPAAVLAILLKRTPLGWTAVGALLVAVAVAVTGVLRGSHASWEGLLTTASLLEILGLAAWVAFFVAYFLGHLPRVDGYLAAFLGVWAVFVMLTPLPEAVYRMVGREDAATVWSTTLVMQAVRYALQSTIVVLLLRTMRSGRALGRGVAPTPAG